MTENESYKIPARKGQSWRLVERVLRLVISFGKGNEAGTAMKRGRSPRPRFHPRSRVIGGCTILSRLLLQPPKLENRASDDLQGSLNLREDELDGLLCLANKHHVVIRSLEVFRAFHGIDDRDKRRSDGRHR